MRPQGLSSTRSQANAPRPPTWGAAVPSRENSDSVLPSHVDPTVAYHERMHLATDDNVVDTWEIDLRGW